MESLLEEHVKQDQRALTEMSAPGKGRPRSLAFEHQVRTILASGCSARAALAQVLGSARVYLPLATYDAYELLVPNLRWYVSPGPNPSSPTLASHPLSSFRFQQQREALGNEAWLYAMIELARAEQVLQFNRLFEICLLINSIGCLKSTFVVPWAKKWPQYVKKAMVEHVLKQVGLCCCDPCVA